MTKRYEKFEGWMLHAPVVTSNGDSGKIVQSVGEGRVAVLLDRGVEILSRVWNLEFIEVGSTRGSPITWEVGQVVWDVRYGKGVVGTLAALEDYPVGVEFQDGKCASYTIGGKNRYDDKYRSLFFSEPKIEAELFPPKKPFVTKLKSGDRVLIKDKHGLFGEGTVRVVHKECDDRIYISEAGNYFMKHDIASLQVLGEEIKF